MTTPRGEEVQDESFLVLFNAHHEPLTFRLPTRRFGARWELELSTAEPELADEARVVGRTRGGRRRVAVDRRAATRGVSGEFRATYRLQLTPEFGFRAGARARPVPRRARRLAPLPVAVVPGARGLDARLRRRRSAPRLRSARRRGGAARACRRRSRRSCSTSSRTTWRERREPVLGRSRSCGRRSSTSTRAPACTGASSTSATSPAFASRTRRSSRRRTRRRSSSSATASSTGCASTTSTGSRTRASTSTGSRARASSTCGSRRSSSRASGCARGRSRGRRATSSSTTSCTCS